MNVGLTGGIGSGKSTVAKIFTQIGIPVYYADERAKALLDESKTLQQEVIQLLGPGIKGENGLDKAKMAQLVFNNPKLLTALNQIIHPAVAEDFRSWYKQQKAPYVLREAAILYESGAYKDCDFVITVFAPKEMRIERVMQRNGISRQEVEQRMDKQWPEKEKLNRADFVLYNDGSKSIIKQVLRIHEDLLLRTNPKAR